jgi:cation diffusion facilitator CzcD-associated flavoprotein CzcO
MIHSGEYRNPALYAGKRVLVVGFGNSGDEIALDLADARSTWRYRSVKIQRRELLGFPASVLGDPVPVAAGAAGRIHQRAGVTARDR